MSGKVARRRRRQRRDEARCHERELRAALEDLGETLLDARERGLPAALGFPSFGAWARHHIPAVRPEWRLTPERVDELAVRAMAAAERRRRAAEVQGQVAEIGKVLAAIDHEGLYTAAGFASLEAYALARFGFGKRQLDVLLAASELDHEAAQP